MKILLDTNVLLCFQWNSSRLSSRIKDLIISSDNEKFISMASIWEVAIKYSLGKLELNTTLEEWIKDIDVIDDLFVLPISETHIVQSAKLPFIHRDPFDRLIFSQSLVENMQLLSLDKVFDEYRVKLNIN